MGLNILGLKIDILLPLHQVFICGTAVPPQLRQFWDTIQDKLANKGPYIASIGDMRMRFLELQDDDKEAKKLRSERLPEGWKDIEKVLYY